MTLIRYEVEDAVALITLDAPPLNVLSRSVLDDLEEGVAAAGAESVRAVVLTGSPHFAAGADISEFQEVLDADGSTFEAAHVLRRVVLAVTRLEKPTLAVVRGYALGGGLELAMSCDYRYFAENATVGLPEVTLGLLPGGGGTQLLPRLVGFQRAKDLMFTGRSVAADEALAIGLADRVVADDAVLDAALDDARRWARGPTRAYGAIKRSLERVGPALDEGFAAEGREFDGLFGTSDTAEGVGAFLSKERPDFSGS